MEFGIMPLWELRETISAFWRDGDFGHELRLACFAWKLRTGDDFTVGELND
jgi:hypothetical protein